jgi:hypothetical protein
MLLSSLLRKCSAGVLAFNEDLHLRIQVESNIFDMVDLIAGDEDPEFGDKYQLDGEDIDEEGR